MHQSYTKHFFCTAFWTTHLFFRILVFEKVKNSKDVLWVLAELTESLHMYAKREACALPVVPEMERLPILMHKKETSFSKKSRPREKFQKVSFFLSWFTHWCLFMTCSDASKTQPDWWLTMPKCEGIMQQKVHPKWNPPPFVISWSYMVGNQPWV